MIHVMAATGLGGAAMAAPVVGYDAIAVPEEEQHLRVPIIGRQRPAMAEDDGLSFAPVLITDFDVGSVFFSDRYVWHFDLPLLLMAHEDQPAADFVHASVPQLLCHASHRPIHFFT